MVQAIISSKSLLGFLTGVVDEFDEVSSLAIRYEKISFLFFEIPIAHKGCGHFNYSKKVLENFKCMISELEDQPLNIEFHEKQIKLIIE